MFPVITEDCRISPGKGLTLKEEPKASATTELYHASAVTGGHATVLEKCPRGFWANAIKFKSDTTKVQRDRVGLTGKLRFLC